MNNAPDYENNLAFEQNKEVAYLIMKLTMGDTVSIDMEVKGEGKKVLLLLATLFNQYPRMYMDAMTPEIQGVVPSMLEDEARIQ